MYTLAATPIDGDHVLGTLGTGGAALVLTVLLILGVRGKGKHRLSHVQAGVIGFIAGTLYLSAGKIWDAPGGLTDSVALTVTGPAGPLGNVGLGALALALSGWWWLGAPRPGKGALQGVMAGAVYAAAGGAWSLVSAFVLAAAGHFGA